MESLEIEVKFLIVNLASLRDRILETGAENRGRYHETNIRFEDDSGSLAQRRSLLRLRRDRKTSLTFKTEVPVQDAQFKIHREWEVEVGDFDIMASILKSLGFRAAQVYEKWRETFVLDDTVLCLDTMPFGNFLEIEGDKQRIKDLADRLDLPWNERILLNYLALFDIVKNHAGLVFNDITFDNFKGNPVNIAALLHLFREPGS